MVSRRTVLAAMCTCVLPVGGSALADEQAFTTEAFHAAQEAGKPILIEIHASWCSTCAAQKPILSQLIGLPKYRDLSVLRVDFDSQKEEVRSLRARVQSTLIVFKGAKEVGRSVGDTKRDTIAALLDKAI
jgi:thioredoxin 1